MLLINGNISTMGGVEYPIGYVRVSGNKITHVGDMSSEITPLDGEEVIELNGRLVLPGYIDAHTHIGLIEDGVGFEGDDINEDTDPCTPHLRALDGINPMDACFAEAVASGITCVVVSPGSTNPIAGQICAMKTVGRSVDEMLVKQPVAIKFAMGENPKTAYSSRTQSPVTRMATAAAIREQLYKAKRYYAQTKLAYDEDEQAEEPDYDAKCEALIPLLKKEIPAHFHAHRAYDILTAMRIAKEFDIRCTIIHGTEGYLVADILAKSKVDVVCGPLICSRTKPELALLSLENPKLLLDAGVGVAISTDYPEIPITFLADSAAIACANKLSRQNALETITINAAKIAGINATVGSIEVGKDADLLVFSSDPLSVCAKPDIVIVNGVKIVD